MALSSACALCLLLPDRFDYSSAISFQLAQGSLSARALFVLMFATLSYVAVRLWTWKRFFGAVNASGVVALLGIIAFTDPRSLPHNATFGVLAGVLVIGHVWAWFQSLDWRVLLTGLGCVVGAGICFYNLGLGERVLICTSCLTLNIIILEYLD